MIRPISAFGTRLRPAALFAALSLVSAAPVAHSQMVLCENGQCLPAISTMTYFNRPAYKLTDGKTEAIIVPQIGRIMSFGKVGGPNLLWNSASSQSSGSGWQNYGGDKNWLAPQSWWKTFHGTDGWPPDPAHDGQPHAVEVISGGKLQMTSPLSPTGIRFIRTLYFDDKGQFVIEQTARKEKGGMVRASIWSITQTAPGDAVFLPMNPQSPYKNGYYKIGKWSESHRTEAVAPNLLRIVPASAGGGSKIGLDSPVSALASVRDGMAFVQKSALPKGQYPDGADGAGFPVEFYVNGDPKTYYYELELLGPLHNFVNGSKWTHTVRWSLHDLPSKDALSSEVGAAVGKLLLGG